MPRERCAAGAKKSPSRRMGFGLPGAPAQKKKKQKENAAKETRQRKLFEKSFLRTLSKTFTQRAPNFRCVAAPPQVAAPVVGKTD